MSSRVQISRHVRIERWASVSDDPVVDPLTAWEYGEEVLGTGLVGDEVRYHEYTGTILVRRTHTIATAIDLETARPEIRAAVRLQVEGEP